MATISSIGTSSRNYSTIQSWHDAFTSGGWIGECYNDSEFGGAVATSFGGKSTSATNYIILRCASGQSFTDNANKLTNALSYNVSNGVGLRRTTSYGNTLTLNEDYITVSGLQIANSAISASSALEFGAGFTHNVVEKCIVRDQGTLRAVGLRAGMIRNSLVVHLIATSGSGIATVYPSAGTKIINCTVVRPSDRTAGGSAILAIGSGANVTVENCAGFGFSNFSSDNSYTGSNNCSDQTISFGSSNQASKTYANQFENTLFATMDFRLKSGSDCIGNGVTDTTNVPNSDDIVGTARS